MAAIAETRRADLPTVAVTDVISVTQNGDWGEAVEGEGYTACRIVRGTDFPAFEDCRLESLPSRMQQGSDCLILVAARFEHQGADARLRTRLAYPFELNVHMDV